MTPHKLLIGGAWRDGGHAELNSNPSDLRDSVGVFYHADRTQVEEAAESASHAQPAWAALPLTERSGILARAGREILDRADEIAALLAREEGKILTEARGEVVRAGDIFNFFAGEVLRQAGEVIPSLRPGVEVLIRREPIGVIGIITPWNFPIAIPAWKIAPALAFGNAVLFKPAELVPACAWLLVDILHRAGVPAGVLNYLPGQGAEVGDAIVRNAHVGAVSFTGSISTGRQVALAAIGHGAKIQLEMGGKNPLVVLDDADLDVAVDTAVSGAFGSTGQRCTASSRFIVQDGILSAFRAGILERLAKIKVGHALDPLTNMGPVVSAEQLEIDLDHIAGAVGEGAKLLFGGGRVAAEFEGHYLAPTLFDETDNSMRINRAEVFGPVATIQQVGSYDEALAVANDTEFGLSAGICTTRLKHATNFRNQIRAGMVMVNVPTAGVDYHAPFGGRGASSFGPREQGRYAVEFYTTVKTAYVCAG